MRLYFPVDSWTGNLIMIEKLVSGGTVNRGPPDYSARRANLCAIHVKLTHVNKNGVWWCFREGIELEKLTYKAAATSSIDARPAPARLGLCVDWAAEGANPNVGPFPAWRPSREARPAPLAGEATWVAWSATNATRR